LTPKLSRNIPKANNYALERHVILVAPEIHWNTGNIGRTCLAADASLHLVKPLGFSLESRNLKRAGLDYWKHVKLTVWNGFDDFLAKMKPQKNEVAVFSKRGRSTFWTMTCPRRLFLIFGSETRGLPGSILRDYRDVTYHIPIQSNIRSLNLSTAVGIALYESLRTAQPFHDWEPFG
jgi:tRNA (cytidine/uridine-2'-O-)-methyltransferase